MFLDDGEGTAEDIGKGARFVDRACFQVNGDHKFRAEEKQAFDGHERSEKAVDERATFIFHGNEQTGISARSAQRRAERATVVVDGQAKIDVGGGDGERFLQFFEAFDGSKASDELLRGGCWWRGRARRESSGRSR